MVKGIKLKQKKPFPYADVDFPIINLFVTDPTKVISKA
jgi:hypothetical protein